MCSEESQHLLQAADILIPITSSYAWFKEYIVLFHIDEIKCVYCKYERQGEYH